MRSGAIIAGARQANLLRGTEKVMLCSRTICSRPARSRLEAIDNLGPHHGRETILGCATALTESAGLELGRVLTDTAKERFGITFTARVTCVWSRRCNRRYRLSRIVLGTAALMVKMGIPIESGHKGQINIWLWITRSQAC